MFTLLCVNLVVGAPSVCTPTQRESRLRLSATVEMVPLEVNTRALLSRHRHRCCCRGEAPPSGPLCLSRLSAVRRRSRQSSGQHIRPSGSVLHQPRLCCSCCSPATRGGCGKRPRERKEAVPRSSLLLFANYCAYPETRWILGILPMDSLDGWMGHLRQPRDQRNNLRAARTRARHMQTDRETVNVVQ